MIEIQVFDGSGTDVFEGKIALDAFRSLVLSGLKFADGSPEIHHHRRLILDAQERLDRLGMVQRHEGEDPCIDCGEGMVMTLLEAFSNTEMKK